MFINVLKKAGYYYGGVRFFCEHPTYDIAKKKGFNIGYDDYYVGWLEYQSMFTQKLFEKVNEHLARVKDFVDYLAITNTEASEQPLSKFECRIPLFNLFAYEETLFPNILRNVIKNYSDCNNLETPETSITSKVYINSHSVVYGSFCVESYGKQIPVLELIAWLKPDADHFNRVEQCEQHN